MSEEQRQDIFNYDHERTSTWFASADVRECWIIHVRIRWDVSIMSPLAAAACPLAMRFEAGTIADGCTSILTFQHSRISSPVTDISTLTFPLASAVGWLASARITQIRFGINFRTIQSSHIHWPGRPFTVPSPSPTPTGRRSFFARARPPSTTSRVRRCSLTRPLSKLLLVVCRVQNRYGSQCAVPFVNV